ncbi:UNVERIFIED_CONTAM: hypothetical protein FKN15_048668 [Acipenser sinensis]
MNWWTHTIPVPRFLTRTGTEVTTPVPNWLGASQVPNQHCISPEPVHVPQVQQIDRVVEVVDETIKAQLDSESLEGKADYRGDFSCWS